MMVDDVVINGLKPLGYKCLLVIQMLESMVKDG